MDVHKVLHSTKTILNYYSLKRSNTTDLPKVTELFKLKKNYSS